MAIMLYEKIKGILTNKTTYLKYLFSYLIIVTVLLASFFLIVKNRLEKRFVEQYVRQSDIKVELISEYIGDELRGLSLVTDSVKSNPAFNSKIYESEEYCKLSIYNEMMKYTSAMRLVQTMAYYSKDIDEVISTNQRIAYKEGYFYIQDGSNSFIFDPSPYYDKKFGQMIFVYNETREYLIYFPSISSKTSDVFFYILNRDEILELMKSVVSEELIAVALLNPEGKAIAGENLSQLMPNIENLITSKSGENNSNVLKAGIYSVNASDSINVHSNINDGFMLAALVSGEYLTSHIGTVFAEAYFLLAAIGIICLLLIRMVMKLTYIPLHRLAYKVAPESKAANDYVKLLDESFDKTKKQNEELKNKVEAYRLSFQKTMLEAILEKQPGTERTGEVCDINVDRFFTEGFAERIFVIKLASPGKEFLCEELQDYMRKLLPGDEPCSLIEKQWDGAVYLVSYSGLEVDKDKVISNMVMQICEEYGYLAAISGGSDSPLDIPMLYNNAEVASGYWDSKTFVDYKLMPHTASELSYPHERLREITEFLTRNQISDAEREINNLVEIIKRDFDGNSEVGDFYTRSIMFDVLFAIADCLKKNNIIFPAEYNESIVLCRSYLHKENKEEIISNIYKILEGLKDSIVGFDAEMLKKVLDESYSDPDFSITIMADVFHVSIAYMSYLVKKNLGQNFSDYLWSLRLEKAKELLSTTDMPADEISIKVGYLNPDSFRRKFKTEMGVTPNQFRRNLKNES